MQGLNSSIGLVTGGGLMGELIRTKQDWSHSKLGDPSAWPQSLRTALSIVLSSRFPMIIFWGEDLSVLYNDAYIPIFGAKHPEVLGKTGFEAWGEVWDVIFPMFQRVRAGEATWSEDQFLALHRHGFTEETYLTWSYSPILDEAGKVGGVFTAVQETTARVLGERRLAVLQNLGEQVAEAKTIDAACASSIATLAKDPHDLPFAALYMVHGDALDTFSLVGSTGIDETLIPAKLDDDSVWPVARVARSNAQLSVERVDVDLPGGPWPEPATQALLLPIAKPGQVTPYGVLIAGVSPRLAFNEAYASFLGLTAQHVASAIANASAYEEEKKRAEALAEIDRAKTTFFSNVSHEFRTPLTLMLGPLQEMRAEGAHSGEDRERLELMYRNAVRLLKLVNSLLDFARIEAGRVEAVYEPTDLAAFTIDLASTFRSAVERAGMVLDVACEALPGTVFVDRAMWEKIVLNLLSNAFKFTFTGAISVRLKQEDDDAVLSVSDTGIGIAEHELPRLFERFHRIEGAASRSHEGTGIGLALVSELVRLHGGTIEVASTLGKGTTFTVRIPRGVRHLPAERVRAQQVLQSTAVDASAYADEATRWISSRGADSEHPLGERATTSATRQRILVADDNADMREYVRRLLGERWEVEVVSDGEAALQALRRERADLVLTDVMMPRLDGFGLLAAIRSDPRLRTIPVVLLSARAGEEATAEGLRAGADDYVVKPFSARDLLVRVTARLSIASVREQERRRLHALLGQVPAIINFLRGPDLVLEYVHPNALQYLGDRELLGKPLLEAIPEFRDQPFHERLRSVWETGVPFSQHDAFLWTYKDGQRVESYWDSVYLPVHDERGRIEGVMTFDHDVTQRVLARQDLMKTNRAKQRLLEQLERADRAKDEFLATMSHELRTPLMAVLGWASILRQGLDDTKQLAKGLEVIERNARAQERLVADLLDVSRIISGKLVLTFEKIVVSDFVRAAMDAVKPAAENKGVQLVAEVEGEAVLFGDAGRLQQVVWNLLANAVRFTPRGGCVSVLAQRAGSSVVIRVQDTGTGIPAEHLPHIFERFRQVDSSTTRAHGGLGLGLAIVRHLVEGHGGSVECTSDGPGRGATFLVRLPMRATSRPIADPSEERSSSVRDPIGEGTTLQGARILVVDDETDSLELVQFVLESAGATVFTAQSAEAALLASGPFDLIVSDIGMPDVDGYAFLSRVRAHAETTGVPAIALTAYAGPEDAERARRAGFQAHFAKPVDAEQLVAAAQKWLRSGTEAREWWKA